MLLFQKRFHAGLVSHEIRLTFRQWPSPRVKVRGRYRVHPIGVVEVDAVDHVEVQTITEDEARRSGFESLAELLGYMNQVAKAPLAPTTRVYRVGLRHAGDGDRVEGAMSAAIDDTELELIRKRLARMDQDGPWTNTVLRLIEKRPRVAASQLAKSLGEETEPFKVNVRKLKRLGLTQSFEVGYGLTPRGKSYLKKAASQNSALKNSAPNTAMAKATRQARRSTNERRRSPRRYRASTAKTS